MRKNFLLWSLTAASMMFFASCENENVPSGAEPATVKITVVDTRNSSGTQNATTAENKISNLEAYTFKSTGERIGYVAVPGGQTSATLNAEASTVTIAVVANSSIGNVASLDELKTKLTEFEFKMTGTTYNSTSVPTDGFVMFATNSVTLNEGANSATISLKRTVSKFEAPTFTPKSGNILDLSNVDWTVIKTIFPTFTSTDDKSTISFDNKSYALANGLDKSILLNNANYNITPSSWPLLRGTWIGTLTYNNSTFETNGTYKTVYSNGLITKAAATPVYVHENFPYADFTVGSVTGYNPKEVYCFVVEGTLKWGTEEVTRYWRVNLVRTTTGTPSNDNYRIHRNGLYKVNVDLVKSIGHSTPQEAEEEVPVIPVDGDAVVTITVDSAPWNVYVSETQM